MNNSILDVFYNVLLKEVATGRVDCFFKYNLRFDTKIVEKDIDIVGYNNNSELLIPTLMIKNKEEFDKLLIQYVESALAFYDDFSYHEEVRDSDYHDNELGISKEKLVMISLWLNATIEDFNDPCMFLKKRIAFFELGNLEKYLESMNVGYSEVLGTDVEIRLVKNGLENETPYALKIYLVKPENNVRIYEFPKIYFGVCDNEAYVYAIQHDKYRLINSIYSKKLDRLMYKVNEGVNVKEDTYDNYGLGNLKDITPNALVGADILMGLLKQNGISKIKVPSILISRWNSKMILLENKKSIWIKDKNISLEEKNKFVDEYYDKILHIQSNLTEKFLRVFRRLGYHHSTTMINSYPYEFGTNLELSILDGDDVCNNILLDEVYNLDFSGKNVRKSK